MEPLFPPWTNSVARAGLLAGVGLVAAVPAALILWVRTPWVTGESFASEQPLQFDHRHHTVDDGIDCRYCHTSVETSASAGYSPTSTCIGCHAQIWNDSPLLAAVRDSMRTGEPLRWKRVHDLPDFVFFHHGMHVRAGVACESCHGRVDEMPLVRQDAPLTMGWCLDCHRDPGPHLRDPALVTAMGLPPGTGAPDDTPPDVHPPLHCYGCHR